MKNIKIIIFVIVVLTATATIYFFTSNRLKTTRGITSTFQAQNVLSPQSDSQGSVTIKVTPKSVTEFSASLDFEIVLDTHFGNLDQDLTKSALLIDENGDQSTPISWEGDLPGGHHRQGILKFAPITPRPKSIELKIAKIGNVEERIFEWELK